MTMVEKVECDNCHELAEIDTVDGWLRATTMVGNPELMQARVFSGRTADHGDFCSLRCLGEWAFAQELLRDLDEEVPEA